MIETEVKFCLGDRTAAEAVVAAAGLPWQAGEFEQNMIYDTPDGRFKARGAIVRIRTRGERAWLTYKEKAGAAAAGAKTRIEHETEISDPDTAAKILAAVGLDVKLRYDKYRASYALPGAVLEIDQLPGGWFCEVEGTPESIATAISACHLTDCSPLALTYPGICRKLFADNLLESPQWTFATTQAGPLELPGPDDPWWTTS